MIIILIFLILVVYLIITRTKNIEKFITNISFNRLIPYRKLSNFIDNKKLQKHINNHCNSNTKIIDNNTKIIDNNPKYYIRHYIGIQCLKYNPILYLSKNAHIIENNKFTVFNFLTNHNNYTFNINDYYKQLYSKLNFLFFQLNNQICTDSTHFTILTLDITIGVDKQLYLKEFNYYADNNNHQHNNLETIYNDLYNNQIDNNYIKIYPTQNTYNKF
jgi:hypothetical protein